MLLSLFQLRAIIIILKLLKFYIQRNLSFFFYRTLRRCHGRLMFFLFFNGIVLRKKNPFNSYSSGKKKRMHLLWSSKGGVNDFFFFVVGHALDFIEVKWVVTR